MNYLNNTPRELIYKERPSLEDFGVYETGTLNAALYECLTSLNRLKPREKGALGEVLRLMNDAYYYLTVIFLEKNPLERYAEICEDADTAHYEFHWMSGQRELVVKCLLYVMLRTFGKKLPPPQMHLLQSICDDINEESSSADPARMARRAMGMEEDPAYKLTSKFQYNAMVGSIKPRDYAPRDIQEVIDSGESLKDCLSYEEHLREAVDVLCKDNKQKLALIERLLEPEKEDFGIMDLRITNAYRSLYELRAELTGEQLPEKLPFENRALVSPPLMHQAPALYDDSEEADVAADDGQTREPQAPNDALAAENERLKAEVADLRDALKVYETTTEIKLHDKVRLDLGLRLLEAAGADVGSPGNKARRGNKARAARVLQKLTGLPLSTCSNYVTNRDLNTKTHEQEVLALNSELRALGIKIIL